MTLNTNIFEYVEPVDSEKSDFEVKELSHPNLKPHEQAFFSIRNIAEKNPSAVTNKAFNWPEAIAWDIATRTRPNLRDMSPTERDGVLDIYRKAFGGYTSEDIRKWSNAEVKKSVQDEINAGRNAAYSSLRAGADMIFGTIFSKADVVFTHPVNTALGTEFESLRKQFDEYIEKEVPVGTKYKDSFWFTDLPSGATSMLLFALMARAGGPKMVGITGAIQGIAEGHSKAMAMENPSAYDCMTLMTAHGILGSTEALPFMEFMGKADKITGGAFSRKLKSALMSKNPFINRAASVGISSFVGAVEEAGQEFGQEFWGEMATWAVNDSDHRDFWEAVKDSGEQGRRGARVGAVLGAGMSGGIDSIRQYADAKEFRKHELLTYHGALRYSQSYPEQTSKIAQKESPSRKDIAEAGLDNGKRWSKDEREALAENLRQIPKQTVSQKIVEADLSTPVENDVVSIVTKPVNVDGKESTVKAELLSALKEANEKGIDNVDTGRVEKAMDAAEMPQEAQGALLNGFGWRPLIQKQDETTSEQVEVKKNANTSDSEHTSSAGVIKSTQDSSKKYRVSDKSVRDNRQQAVIEGDQITISNYNGRQLVNSYTISKKDWDNAKKRYANENAGLAEFMKEAFPDMPQLPPDLSALRDRIRDAQISAVKKVIAKQSDSNGKDVTELSPEQIMTNTLMEDLIKSKTDQQSNTDNLEASSKTIEKKSRPKKKISKKDNLKTKSNAAMKEANAAISELGDLLSTRLGANQFADPQVLKLVGKATGKLIEAGVYKFADAVQHIYGQFAQGWGEDRAQKFMLHIGDSFSRGWEKIRENPQYQDKLSNSENITDIIIVKPKDASDENQGRQKPESKNSTALRETEQSDSTADRRNDTPKLDGQSSGIREGSKEHGDSKENSDRSAGRSKQEDGKNDRKGHDSTGSQRSDLSRVSDLDFEAGDYQIDSTTLAVGGSKTKYKANVKAITTLNTIEAEGRNATKSEQDILAQYTGWGMFPGVFNPTAENAGQWVQENREIKELLDKDEYEAARRSTLNAHYTSAEVVDAIWKMAQRLGFAGGRILEPAMGTGNFFGLLPKELRGNTSLTGVELDRLTGRIAKQLYPSANIQIKGYEQTSLPRNFFDIVVGNVPFADIKPFDPIYNKKKASLHDYFFLKSIEMTRPGGVMLLLTSRYSMDKADSRFRKMLAQKADLVAAFRLPDTAFKANAGTEVVTDLIVLQRRGEGQEAGGKGWLELGTVKDPDGGDDISINEYYVKHPEHILGRLDRSGTMYSSGQINVSGKGKSLSRLLDKAISLLPADVMTPHQEIDMRPVELVGDAKDGEYSIKNGTLMQVKNGQVQKAKFEGKDSERISRVILQATEIKSALQLIFDAELQNKSDSELEVLRHQLNVKYDSFVKEHGALSKRTNKSLLVNIPQLASLLALETKYAKSKATKADVFTKRTLSGTPKRNKASTIESAYSISLGEKGRIDLKRMAELLSVDESDVVAKLRKTEYAYEDPESGWQPAYLYLSGNVKRKLSAALAATKTDSRYTRNVAALEAVQPPDVAAQDIQVRIGMPWIPANDIKEFAKSLVGGDIAHFEIDYASQVGWRVGYTRAGENKHKGTSNDVEIFGTPDRRFTDILEAALNNKSIVVTRTDSEGKSYRDQAASEAANGKVEDVSERFKDWIWENDERRIRLVAHYNDTFNTDVETDYIADHYKNDVGEYRLPGMAASAYALREHQAKAIWRAVVDGKAIFAHEVGTGKTMTMVGASQELKRLGLSRKPAIVVPKARLKATVAEALEMYPALNVLTIDKLGNAKQRRELLAKVATNEWDLIVMSHDTLNGTSGMAVKPETEEEFLSGELDELESVLMTAKEEKATARGKDIGNGIVKDLEKAKEKLQNNIKEATSRKDTHAVYFEETGIDSLFVDEAHAYKSYPIKTTHGRVRGVPNSKSQRASKMMMQSRYLMKLNGGRGLSFLTGTPIANTLAELYILQRYFQPNDLESAGVLHFDSWASQFAEIESRSEFKVDGSWDRVSRMSSYANLKALHTIAKRVMDIKLADSLVDPETGESYIVRPNRKDDVESVEMTEQQDAYLQTIKDRTEAVRGKGRPEKGEDNMLSISGDARKSALSMQLVESGHAGEPGGKVEACAQKVLHLWYEDSTRTQMVFSDLGVNKTKWGYSVYDDLIAQLVEGGIAREKIVVFKGGMTDNARLNNALKLKTGAAVVGIGGSETMGTGINAQDHLYALHHLDVPWIPAHIEQRDGRGWRQGNRHEDVHIIRYVTEKSFDTLMWQTVDRKWKFINKFLKGEDLSEFNDMGDSDEISYAEIMAITAGNPLLLEKVNLEQEVKLLQNASARHTKTEHRLRDEVFRKTQQLEKINSEIDLQTLDLEQNKGFSDQFAIKLQEKTYSKMDDAVAAFSAVYKDLQSRNENFDEKVGEFKNFDIHVIGKRQHGRGLELSAYLKSANGTALQMSSFSPRSATSLASSTAIRKRIESYKNQAKRISNDLDTLRPQIGKPFKRQDVLAEKQSRFNMVTEAVETNHTSIEALQRSKEVADILSADEGKTYKLGKEPGEFFDENNMAASPQAVELATSKAVRLSEAEKAMQEADNAATYTPMASGIAPATRKKIREDQVDRIDGKPSPEIEKRIQAAHGIKKDALLQRTKDIITNAWHKITRSTVHLPSNESHFAYAREWFRLFKEIPSYSGDEAARRIAAIVDPLGSKQMAIFERVLIAQNLLASVDRGEPLRFGFGSREEVEAWLNYETKRAEKAINSDGSQPVLNALATRKKLIRELVEELVVNDLLPDSALDNVDSYYHQQVVGLLKSHKHAQRSGANLNKKSFQKKRVKDVDLSNEMFDYNTSYIEAEISWVTDALIQIQKKKRLKQLDNKYGILKRLKDQAKSHNFIKLVGGIEIARKIEKLRDSMRESRLSGESPAERAVLVEQLTMLDPTYSYRKRIAIGIQTVWSAIDNDRAILGPFLDRAKSRFKIDEFGGENAFLTSEWMAILNYLASHDDGLAGMGAKSVFKAIREMDAMYRERLGDEYETWESLLKKTQGYTAWQPQEGNIFYQATTIPEKIAEAVRQGMSDDLKLSEDDLKSVRIMGGPREQYVLPNEIASQLDEMKKPDPQGVISKIARNLLKTWKLRVLLGPDRAVGYMIRNVTGDMDPVLAVAPGITKHIGNAFGELQDYYNGKLAISKEMKQAVRHGVISSAFTAAETSDIRQQQLFAHLDQETLSLRNLPKKAFLKYWDSISLANEIRESVLRYAAYLYYLENLNAPNASSKADINELRKSFGREVAAARAARDLMGDYSNLSIFSEWLRTNLIPFWSWQAINARRYPAIIRNAWQRGGAVKAGGVIGKTAVRAFLTSRILTLYAIMYAWNHLLWDEEEESLNSYDRQNPHIILGKNSDGTIRILRNTGAVGDFLEWFGINTAINMLPLVMDEQVSGWDLMSEMVKDPVNKIAGGLRPDLKLPFEVLPGKSYFPDTFNPRTVDRGEAVAGSLALREEYRAAKGYILQDGTRARQSLSQRLLGIGSVDPRKAALYSIYDLRDKYARSQGRTVRSGSSVSPFRPMREAAMYGDYEAFVEAREAYIKSGKNISNFKSSLRYIDPIASFMNDEDERMFTTEFLSGDQKRQLKIARDFAFDLKVKLWHWWQKADQEDGGNSDGLEYKKDVIMHAKNLAKPKPMKKSSADVWRKDVKNSLAWLKSAHDLAEVKREYWKYLKKEMKDPSARNAKWKRFISQLN